MPDTLVDASRHYATLIDSDRHYFLTLYSKLFDANRHVTDTK